MSPRDFRYRAIRWKPGIAILIGLSAVPSLSRATDTPDQGPPAEVSPQPADAIQAPVGVSESTLGLRNIEMSFVPIASLDPADKGSIMTDAGRQGGMASPTAAEEVKLAMARAAIEASRAAGLLGGTIVPGAAAAVAPSDAAQSKVRMMLARGASPLPADAASGVGVDGAIQEFGPPELTPAELAKIAGSEAPSATSPGPTPAHTTDLDKLHGDGKEMISR